MPWPHTLPAALSFLKNVMMFLPPGSLPSFLLRLGSPVQKLHMSLQTGHLMFLSVPCVKSRFIFWVCRSGTEHLPSDDLGTRGSFSGPFAAGSQVLWIQMSSAGGTWGRFLHLPDLSFPGSQCRVSQSNLKQNSNTD